MKSKFKKLLAACLAAGALFIAQDSSAQRKLPNGTIVYPDGSRQLPDGTVIYRDGLGQRRVITPDGRTSDGGVVRQRDRDRPWYEGDQRRRDRRDDDDWYEDRDDRRFREGRRLPPGQAKKRYGGSAKDYAPGQVKKRNGFGHNGKGKKNKGWKD